MIYKINEYNTKMVEKYYILVDITLLLLVDLLDYIIRAHMI